MRVDPLLVLGALAIGAVVLGPRKALGYVNGQPVSLDLEPIGGGLWLFAPAARAYLAMRDAAAAAGVTLKPTGEAAAFRTQEQQTRMTQERSAFAAAVGYSPHQRGVAIDLETAVGANATYRWLQDNAARFGFYQTTAVEPWHWQWKGNA